MKQIITNVIDYGEFEKLIADHYNVNYEFAPDMECGNDTDHLYSNVVGKIADYDLDTVGAVRMGTLPKGGFIGCVLLNMLVLDGHLTPGNYLIRVSW